VPPDTGIFTVDSGCCGFAPGALAWFKGGNGLGFDCSDVDWFLVSCSVDDSFCLTG
jgi:hypothetical protein